jgi:mannitol/fructose-specific phosphotransferase system IIA component (Ntr-type)
MARLTLEGQGYSRDFIERVANEAIIRENLGSTGIGMGAAAPHARANIPRMYSGLFLCPGGLDFAACDGEPVDIFFFLVGCQNNPGDHLRRLELFSRHMKDEQFATCVRRAKTDDELKSIIREYDQSML